MADRIDVRYEGLSEILTRMNNLGLNLESCARTAAWRTGGRVLFEAKRNCSVKFTGTPSWNPEPGTPTGRLMSSLSMRSNFSNTLFGMTKPAKQGDEIQSPASSEDAKVAVGTNVEYAIFPEFGTRRMHARSYLSPAWLRHGQTQVLIANLKNVVEKKAAWKNFNQLLPIFDPAGATD